MPTTLSAAIESMRSRLDESSPRFWSDTELTTWLNEGARQIAIRTEALRDIDIQTIPIPSNTFFNLPTDVIRVHRVEYLMDGSNQIYRLQAINVSSVDSVGWMNQDQEGIPEYFFTWGFNGDLGSPQLYLYPKPSTAGTLKTWYYRLPHPATTATQTLEIPEGWVDIIYEYCEYKARIKDGDDRWQVAKQEYESKLNDMYNMTRDMHDQASYIVPYGAGGRDMWADDWGW